MPQLDKFIFFPQLFWLLLILAGLYLLLVGWFLPRLLRSLKFRRVHRGRLGRTAVRSGQSLVRLLPSLAATAHRSAGLVPAGSDRFVGSLALALATFRRQLPSPLPLRPLVLSSTPTPFPAFPLPVFPGSISQPGLFLPTSLLPAVYYRRTALLPSISVSASLSPPSLPVWIDVLAPMAPAPALFLSGLAARQIHRELLLWLDPLASASALEESSLSSLRGLVRPPLTHLPSLSLGHAAYFSTSCCPFGYRTSSSAGFA